MRKLRLPNIPEAPEVMVLRTNGFLYHWCCYCDARHVWHFQVRRGRTPDEDEVVISVQYDEIGTKLMRRLKRLEGGK